MENNKHPADFDFDQWASIAKQDPERFEQMRLQLINEVMEQAPDYLKQRLEGLQWQVDQIRNQTNNPMASCLTISQRMWDSVYGEKGLLNALQEPEKLFPSPHHSDTNNVVSIKKATD